MIFCGKGGFPLFAAICGYFIIFILLELLPQPLPVNIPTIMLLWIFANAIDIHSTRLCLSTGRGREGNPLMRFLFEKVGFWTANILVKIPGIFILIYLLSAVPGLSKNPALSMTIVFLLIAINNYRLARRFRQKNRNNPS